MTAVSALTAMTALSAVTAFLRTFAFLEPEDQNAELNRLSMTGQ